MIEYHKGVPRVRCDGRPTCSTLVYYTEATVENGWRMERGERVGVPVFYICPACVEASITPVSE